MKIAIQRASVVLMAVCILSLSVFSQNLVKHNTRVVDVETHIDHIYLYPKQGFEKAILTVSKPDGSVVKYEFESWDTPKIELDNGKMDMFPDGMYTYTLNIVPEVINRVRSDVAANSLNQKKLDSNYINFTAHFSIANGMFLGSEEIEETADENFDMQGKESNISTEDVVHPDDVIVQSSLCVGFDCVNGENFGFDTFRLKENNLRIHFQDTSSTGSFPSNDWRLVANDSSSGGANYLAIEDATSGRYPFKVEAGARNNALYVEADGDVGIGTANPTGDLHIVTGNTPTVRLEQDGSNGFTAQTYDIAANEANFFIRDVTNGSKLFFRSKPGAPADSLFIDSNGYIGLGTSSPDYALEIENSDNIYSVLNCTAGTQFFQSATSGYGNIGTINDFPFRMVVNSTWMAQFNNDKSLTMRNGASCSNVGVWTNASSRDYKENILEVTSDEAYDTLNNLSPVKYNYKEDTEQYVGFIAEDVPELVATRDRKGMSPMDVVAVLTKVVKDQQSVISDLKERLENLEKKEKSKNN